MSESKTASPIYVQSQERYPGNGYESVYDLDILRPRYAYPGQSLYLRLANHSDIYGSGTMRRFPLNGRANVNNVTETNRAGKTRKTVKDPGVESSDTRGPIADNNRNNDNVKRSGQNSAYLGDSRMRRISDPTGKMTWIANHNHVGLTTANSNVTPFGQNTNPTCKACVVRCSESLCHKDLLTSGVHSLTWSSLHTEPVIVPSDVSGEADGSFHSTREHYGFKTDSNQETAKTVRTPSSGNIQHSKGNDKNIEAAKIDGQGTAATETNHNVIGEQNNISNGDCNSESTSHKSSPLTVSTGNKIQLNIPEPMSHLDNSGDQKDGTYVKLNSQEYEQQNTNPSTKIPEILDLKPNNQQCSRNNVPEMDPDYMYSNSENDSLNESTRSAGTETDESCENSLLLDNVGNENASEISDHKGDSSQTCDNVFMDTSNAALENVSTKSNQIHEAFDGKCLEERGVKQYDGQLPQCGILQPQGDVQLAENSGQDSTHRPASEGDKEINGGSDETSKSSLLVTLLQQNDSGTTKLPGISTFMRRPSTSGTSAPGGSFNLTPETETVSNQSKSESVQLFPVMRSTSPVVTKPAYSVAQDNVMTKTSTCRAEQHVDILAAAAKCAGLHRLPSGSNSPIVNYNQESKSQQIEPEVQTVSHDASDAALPSGYTQVATSNHNTLNAGIINTETIRPVQPNIVRPNTREVPFVAATQVRDGARYAAESNNRKNTRHDIATILTPETTIAAPNITIAQKISTHSIPTPFMPCLFRAPVSKATTSISYSSKDKSVLSLASLSLAASRFHGSRSLLSPETELDNQPMKSVSEPPNSRGCRVSENTTDVFRNSQSIVHKNTTNNEERNLRHYTGVKNEEEKSKWFGNTAESSLPNMHIDIAQYTDTSHERPYDFPPQSQPAVMYRYNPENQPHNMVPHGVRASVGLNTYPVAPWQRYGYPQQPTGSRFPGDVCVPGAEQRYKFMRPATPFNQYPQVTTLDQQRELAWIHWWNIQQKRQAQNFANSIGNSYSYENGAASFAQADRTKMAHCKPSTVVTSSMQHRTKPIVIDLTAEKSDDDVSQSTMLDTSDSKSHISLELSSTKETTLSPENIHMASSNENAMYSGHVIPKQEPDTMRETTMNINPDPRVVNADRLVSSVPCPKRPSYIQRLPCAIGSIQNSRANSDSSANQYQERYTNFVQHTSIPEMKHQRSFSVECKPTRLLDPLAVHHMTQWLMNHMDHPYPTPAEKKALAKLGNITVTQVSSWFANKRSRLGTSFGKKTRTRKPPSLQRKLSENTPPVEFKPAMQRKNSENTPPYVLQISGLGAGKENSPSGSDSDHSAHVRFKGKSHKRGLSEISGNVEKSHSQGSMNVKSNLFVGPDSFAKRQRLL